MMPKDVEKERGEEERSDTGRAPSFVRKVGLWFRGRVRRVSVSISTLLPLMRLLWQASPGFFLASLAMTLLTGILPTGTMFVSSLLLQTLVQGIEPGQQKSAIMAQCIWLLVLLAATHLGTQLTMRISGVVQQLHRTRVTNHVQLLVTRKAAEIDLACFEDAEFQNNMRTAAQEASYRVPMFLDRLLLTGSAATLLVSLTAILFFWQAWIVVLIFLVSLLGLWVSTSFAAQRVQLISQRSETERKKFYLNMILTSDQWAKEVRLFGLGSYLLKRFTTLLELTYHQDRQLAMRELRYSGAVSLVLALAQPALFAFTAFEALAGAITIGQFSLYTQSIIQLERSWDQMVMIQSGLHESNLFAARLFEFLTVQPQIEAPRHPSHTSTLSEVPSVEFRHVSFRYPGVDRAVLDDVSFTLRPGEMVAIVGENGAGKTTLVKLLAGLYEPSSGQILFDGVDICVLDREALRAFLSVIFQDFAIYHFSARDNIGVGQVSIMDDDEHIRAAARQSGFDQVVTQLPDGYDTVLGRFWDRGYELSGGQKQLAALSRAHLRNAPILILDEPSSALDVYAERHFFQQLLGDHDTGRLQTILFISHRFTTVRRADRILVMEHGKLVESGNHDELLARNGLYAEMFRAQAAPYQQESVERQRNSQAHPASS